MRIEKEIDKIIYELNRLTKESNEMKIEFSKVSAFSKTNQAILKDLVKQFEKLNKNLSKAGDDCACKPIGHDNQCEEISQ